MRFVPLFLCKDGRSTRTKTKHAYIALVEVVRHALRRGEVASTKAPLMSALFPHPHPTVTTAPAPRSVPQGLPPTQIPVHVATATRASSPAHPTPPGTPPPSPANTSTGARYTAPEEARGVILYVLEDHMTEADVSVIYPDSLTYRRSATQHPDTAAAHSDAAKIAKYRRWDGASYTFVPMSIEPYGRLGAPRMDLIRRIGCEAAECSEFKLSSA
jgi:hypothetical protein